MTIDKGSSPIEFRLDPSSGVPTYLQLVQQVEHALRLGYLKPGDQLPKVRDVVASLTINPNTVLKAYKELETKGLTAGRPGQGTFIQASPDPGRAPRVGRPAPGHARLARLRRRGRALTRSGDRGLFTSVLRDFYKEHGRAADGGAAADGETEGVA